MKPCHFCLLPKKLCDSHVIPEFLYEHAYHDGSFISVTNNPHHPVRPRQKGFTERLLCEACEAWFNRWERPVATLLRTILATPAPGRESLILFQDDRQWQFFDFNYTELKLCALSILWRCHVAKSHPFKRLDLGPHAKKIRLMLLNDDPGLPSDYSIVLFRLLDSDIASRTVLPPLGQRFNLRGLPSMRGYKMRAMGFDWMYFVSGFQPDQLNQQPIVGAGPKLMVMHDSLDDLAEMLKLRDSVAGWGKL